MRRTKEEAAITRESVLKAALAVFGCKGYSAATLKDVAREAGVTRGAIYWHYGSKAELFIALETKYSARSGEMVRMAAAEGGGLAAILRRVFVRLLEAVENDPELRSVMELSLFKTEHTYELAAAEKQNRDNGLATLTEITAAMRAGIAAGELRHNLDPVEAARGYLALQNGIIYLWLQDPQAFSLKKSAGPLAEVFLQGIQAKKK